MRGPSLDKGVADSERVRKISSRSYIDVIDLLPPFLAIALSKSEWLGKDTAHNKDRKIFVLRNCRFREQHFAIA